MTSASPRTFVGLAVIALALPLVGCRAEQGALAPAASAHGTGSVRPASTRAAMPPNPRRKTPPAGIEARALRPGQVAPDFTLPTAAARPWSLNKHLAGGPVVLVFYRGHW